MSSDSSALGDRMKTYERAARYQLPLRTYTICRVDGRAFHSLLRKAVKPFDFEFMTAMDRTAAALCKEMTGTAFAYCQSDEISVLLTDFGSVHSEPWFGGGVRSRWVAEAAPDFKAETGSFLAEAIPAMPSLNGTTEVVPYDERHDT